MDKFDEISAFIAVVDAGGFSAAARSTGKLQSAISKAVNTLEQRLELRLLHRSTRKVTLTEQGRDYYERMKPLIEEITAADDAMTKSAHAVSGLVRIAAPSTFGRMHLLPLLPDLLGQHPGLRVDVILSDAVRDMIEDKIDLAIRLNPVNDPESVVRRVAGTALACVGSRRYFAQFGMPRTPSDLASHNCLVYHGLAAWPFSGPEGRIEMPVHGTLSSNSIETILSGVKAGIGIGMFTRASLQNAPQDGDLVMVLEEFVDEPRDINLVWPKRQFVPARVRSVTAFLTEALGRRF